MLIISTWRNQHYHFCVFVIKMYHQHLNNNFQNQNKASKLQCFLKKIQPELQEKLDIFSRVKYFFRLPKNIYIIIRKIWTCACISRLNLINVLFKSSWKAILGRYTELGQAVKKLLPQESARFSYYYDHCMWQFEAWDHCSDK